MSQHASKLFLHTVVGAIIIGAIAGGTFWLLSSYAGSPAPTTDQPALGTATETIEPTPTTPATPGDTVYNGLRGTIEALDNGQVSLRPDSSDAELIHFVIPADLQLQQNNTAAAPAPGSRVAPALTDIGQEVLTVGATVVTDLADDGANGLIATTLIVLH